MTILDYPSYAADYEFNTLYYNENGDLTFYGVSEHGWEAEKDCELLRQQGYEPIILHNVRIQHRRK